MASESTSNASDGTPITEAELYLNTQKQLAENAQHQAKINAQSNGEILPGSQTGATVDYSKTGIRELPIAVISLMAPSVESKRLALSHNPRITIPKELALCDRLRYLNMRANKLVEFPQNILLLTKLEILDLSKNEITSIPEGIKTMTSLKFLAIVRNQIKRLPLALGEMPNLHKLKFEENPIEFPSLEELQLPEEHRAGAAEVDKDREMCQQVKRVLKSKALRQRLLKSPAEDEASESNTETPRPRRLANGRFPVRPSISKIDISDITRSASNSPPEASQLTTKPSIAGTPTKHGNIPAGVAAPPYTNGSAANRSRSESASTTASIRARRQGFVPVKRNNELGSVSEITNANLIRSSNASTIKASHAYKASTSSILSGLESSSGAETPSVPGSPVDSSRGDLRLLTTARRQHEHNDRPSNIRRSQTIQATRRLQFSLSQLYRPLHQIALGVFNGITKRSNLKRQLYNASVLTEELDKQLVLLDNRACKAQEEAELKRKVMALVQSALQTYGFVMDALRTYVTKIGFSLNPVQLRCLMHQLYAITVEARNVLQLLNFPVNHTVKETKEIPRASRITNAASHRTITPTETKPLVATRRMRGATILRNEVSNSGLRVIPPAKSVDTSRTNTMTSFTSAATPISADSFAPLQSAALPSRTNTMRAMLNTSSDEQDEGSEQFEGIFLKLREACDIASRALPACHAEITTQIDNAAARSEHRGGRLWHVALKSYNNIARAYQELSDRLGAVRLKDPGVRNQKDFWQLCDTFVQSWTEFALNIRELSSTTFDITTIRSVMKPMQRAVKDLSKTISDSQLYHQALRGPTNGGHRTLGLPFPLALNTAQAQAVAHLASSNPASAAPSSAHSTTVSVPATPLTAALGPAAQATLVGTPNRSATIMNDYFDLSSIPPLTPFAPVNTVAAPQAQPHMVGYGRR